ncbi:MAG: TfoX/Sxy family protein [Planctomycetota bacterium]|nr:TfoX/Sxy family protein [Planctomycetota bacterium]
MAFDEKLAERIRRALKRRHGIREKKMFGGLAFLLHGHMTVGVVGEMLMVRVGPAAYAGALKLPHARAMDFTGKPLTGFVYVESPGSGTQRGWRLGSSAGLPSPRPCRRNKLYCYALLNL